MFFMPSLLRWPDPECMKCVKCVSINEVRGYEGSGYIVGYVIQDTKRVLRISKSRISKSIDVPSL
jgi:hypothetical protein